MYDASVPKISLEAARVNAHISQKSAAEALGIATETLRSYEHGKTCPSVNMLNAMSNLYQYPKDYIFIPSIPL